MPGTLLQVDAATGKLRIKDDKVVMAGQGDPCSCGCGCGDEECNPTTWANATHVRVRIAGWSPCPTCLPGGQYYTTGTLTGDYLVPLRNSGVDFRAWQSCQFQCGPRWGNCGFPLNEDRSKCIVFGISSLNYQLSITNGFGAVRFFQSVSLNPPPLSSSAPVTLAHQGSCNNTGGTGGIATIEPCGPIPNCANCVGGVGPPSYFVSFSNMRLRTTCAGNGGQSAKAQGQALIGTFQVLRHPSIGCRYELVTPWSSATFSRFNSPNCDPQTLIQEHIPDTLRIVATITASGIAVSAYPEQNGVALNFGGFEGLAIDNPPFDCFDADGYDAPNDIVVDSDYLTMLGDGFVSVLPGI